MGLDVSHGCWHGAYSAFSRWRNKIAEVADYTISTGENGLEYAQLDWGSIEASIGRELDGKWVKMPVRHNGTPDPLIVLLAHSDCDGELQVGCLVPLADRLEELLPLLGDEDGGGHIGSFANKTQTFIDGLRLAAANNEPVEFS